MKSCRVVEEHVDILQDDTLLKRVHPWEVAEWENEAARCTTHSKPHTMSKCPFDSRGNRKQGKRVTSRNKRVQPA